MHLNKILEQIKRHQSPTEAIDKLATALEKHEGSLLEKGFTILKSELAANMYEAINGPHFDEEHAHYAVEGMENEDGTKGPHWTVEETTSVANQMGINLKSEKHNKSVSKLILCRTLLLQVSIPCLVKMLQDSTFLVLR